jgi:hypothetical protein
MLTAGGKDCRVSPFPIDRKEPPVTNAREMARVCDQYVSAMWRGESDEVVRFSSWLRNHWALGPDEPDKPPAAFSAVGGGGAGIRW